MALQERAQSPILTAQDLRDYVAKLARVRCGQLPTPLEELPRLREVLGENAPRLFVKRDDLTGVLAV